MSALSQFTGGGGIKPSGVINGTAVATFHRANGSMATGPTGLIGTTAVNPTLTGALTANTLATVLSLSGKGVLSFAACSSQDATSRTHRMKITLDGVVIYDATTAATVQVGDWLIPIGSVCNHSTLSPGVIYEPIVFNSSLLIEYASSISETGKTYIATRYMARA